MSTVVLTLDNDVSTDVIYPGRYMATVLPSETPQYAFADSKEFNARLQAKQVPPESVIVAGKNFGCGSSREQAVSTLAGHQLIIVAEGFARIFLQNVLKDEARRAKLGEPLAARCQAAVDTRIRAARRAAGEGWLWFVSSGWEKRTELLFTLAAEVAGKLEN